jgi:electron transport complex protein RnfG
MSADTQQRSSYIRQAWLVILLGLLYGAALAGVQTGLGPIIEENKRRETFGVIPELVTGTDPEHIAALELTTADGKARRVYRAANADDQLLGWVVPASGLGFADRIDLLIGLDPHVEQITGLYVLDQKETPGLGNLIVDADFRDQFVDKSALKPLEVVKTEAAPGSNEIRALTGATISSQSVADIVNKAVEELRQPILDQSESKE